MKYAEITPERMDELLRMDDGPISMCIAEMQAEKHCDVSIMMYDLIARAVMQSRRVAHEMGATPSHYVHHLTSALATAIVQFNVDCCPPGNDREVFNGVGTMLAMVGNSASSILKDALAGNNITKVPQ